MRSTFDHIEVHVADINRYCDFLTTVFEGGDYEVISQSGTSMFRSPEGIHIEVKKRKSENAPVEAGFCNPCLRRSEVQNFIATLGFGIKKQLQTPEGPVYFFEDHEGVTWHIKERNR
jgi:hypothetical protein